MVMIPGVEVDEARLAAICDKYGIAELKVFGSRARGQAAPDSDIDILYTLRPGQRLGWEIEQLRRTGQTVRPPGGPGVPARAAPAVAAVSAGRSPVPLCSVTSSCSPR